MQFRQILNKESRLTVLKTKINNVVYNESK